MICTPLTKDPILERLVGQIAIINLAALEKAMRIAQCSKGGQYALCAAQMHLLVTRMNTALTDVKPLL